MYESLPSVLQELMFKAIQCPAGLEVDRQNPKIYPSALLANRKALGTPPLHRFLSSSLAHAAQLSFMFAALGKSDLLKTSCC